MLHFPKAIEASAELDKLMDAYFGDVSSKVLALFGIKTDAGVIPMMPDLYPPTHEALEQTPESFATSKSSARNVFAAPNPLEKAEKSYPTFIDFAASLGLWKDDKLDGKYPIVPLCEKERDRANKPSRIQSRIERIRAQARALQNALDNGPSISGQDTDDNGDTAPDAV